MLGHESVVGHAHVSHRAGEHTTRRHLAPSTVEQAGDRVARIPHGMPAIVQQSLGGTVTLHEGSNATSSTPPVGALTACVGAVDPAAPGPVQLRNRRRTHGTRVLADHVADHVDIIDTDRHLHHEDDDGEGVSQPCPVADRFGHAAESSRPHVLTRPCRIVSRTRSVHVRPTDGGTRPHRPHTDRDDSTRPHRHRRPRRFDTTPPTHTDRDDSTRPRSLAACPGLRRCVERHRDTADEADRVGSSTSQRHRTGGTSRRRSASCDADPVEAVHVAVRDLIDEGGPRLVSSGPCGGRNAHLAVEAFGLRGPHRLDTQETSVEPTNVILPIVERRSPAGSLERAAVSRFEQTAMATGTSDGATKRSGHATSVNDRACGTSDPKTCEFAGEEHRHPVGSATNTGMTRSCSAAETS